MELRHCLQANLYLKTRLSMRWVITHNFLPPFLYRQGKELRWEPSAPFRTATAATVYSWKTNSDVKWEMVGKGQWGFQRNHVTG